VTEKAKLKIIPFALAIIVVAAMVLVAACTQATPEAPPEQETKPPSEEEVKPPPEEELEPFKIGASYAFSGPYSATSQECYNGAVLAYEEIEAMGGVNGHPLVHIYEDDASDVDKATANFKKFASQDEVIALQSGYFVCLPLVELADKYKLPYQTHSACGAYCVAETESKYDMCTWALAGPNYPPVWENDAWGEYKGDHLRMIRELDLPVKKVAIMYARVGILETMGTGAEDYYKRLPDEYDVVMVEAVEVGKKDFTAEVLKLKELQPDAVIAQLVASDAALLVRQMRELDYNPPLLYGGFSAPTPDFKKGVGEENLEGIIGIMYVIKGASPADTYIQKFEERWGYEPEYHSAYAYENVWEIYFGIKALLDAGKPVTGENLWQSLHDLELPLSEEYGRVLSPLEYLEGEMMGVNKWACIKNFQFRKNGEKELIYSPLEEHDKFLKPLVYPMPTWAEK